MKRGSVLPVILSLTAIFLLVAGMFFFFVMYEPDNSDFYESQADDGELINPVKQIAKEINEESNLAGSDVLETSLQDQVKTRALREFNEDYVYYLLVLIKSYNLHNPPLSSDNPEIEIIFEDEVYSAIVSDGIIKVNKWEIEEEDIRIKSRKVEIVKMLLDESYIVESFNNGGSSIELISSKSDLFAKGYLNLYTEVTGKSITGNVVRIYLN